jgi:hypothetical protein
VIVARIYSGVRIFGETKTLLRVPHGTSEAGAEQRKRTARGRRVADRCPDLRPGRPPGGTTQRHHFARLPLLLLAPALPLAACQREGPVERTGRSIGRGGVDRRTR